MTPEEVLARAEALRQYPARSPNPAMPTVDATRLSIPELESMLATTQGKPIDYSRIEELNRSRESAGTRDMLIAAALQMKGGEGAAPIGRKLFEKALETRSPLRLNLADTGYTDPETGAFIENPQVARGRDEKVIMSRLDSRIREEETKARLALAQGNATQSDIHKQNQEMMNLIKLSILQQGANTSALLAEARSRNLDAKGAGKPDSLTEKQRNNVANIDGQIALTDQAVAAATKTPSAFTFRRGLPQAVAGQLGESAVGRTDTPEEATARSFVYNNVSQVIKDRAGTAQSAQELARLNTFLPSPYDDAEQIKNKMGAFRKYLIEQRNAQGTVVPKAGAGPAAADPNAGGWTTLPNGVRIREKK